MKTAAVYDAQFMHNLSVIAQSETLTKRLIKYVNRLAMPAADPTLMTREEFMTKIDKARKQTGKQFANVDELDQYIRNL